MSGWLWNKNSSQGLKPNGRSQLRCSRFIEIERAVRRARSRGEKDTEFMKLHSSYEELEQCARDKCRACTVVRQALLLSRITGEDVKKMERRDAPVYLRLSGGDSSGETRPRSQSTLQVRLGVLPESSVLVEIALTTNIKQSSPEKDPFVSAVPQIDSWLRVCREEHECTSLTQSGEHPRRLIEIVSATKVRLLDTSELPNNVKLKYVALSYCWGKGRSKGRTTPCNRDKRLVSFETWALPKTIRDALKLVRALGLKYLWVDQICITQKIQWDQKPIPQEHDDQRNGGGGDGYDDCRGVDCEACSSDAGEDWNAEASRMHVIYGNAVFTLCACSSTSSVDGLIWPRKAWTYSVVPFYFEGQWLVSHNMSLNEVRATAPLSKRAWTLQEERLSPRLLYYCGQRVYWSCVEKQDTEVAARSAGKPDAGSGDLRFEREDEFQQMSAAQVFIKSRFTGERVRLHQEWNDVVEAYCPREITKATDRFPAISGLAAQYLSTYVTQDNRIPRQEYLAGLWRETFPEDLAWSAKTAADPRKALLDIAPSWSWASLPVGAYVSTKQSFSRCEQNDFQLLGGPNLSMGPNGPAERKQDPRANILHACQEGAKKKRVSVRGRLRRIISPDSERIDWVEMTNSGRGGKNKYNLSRYLARHVHARNPTSGQMVIFEPTKQHIEGQLDYSLPPDDDGIDTPYSEERYVAPGLESDLFGLEIGLQTMLLLQWRPRAEDPREAEKGKGKTASGSASGTGVGVFRRVGICRNVRKHFFEGVEKVQLELE
ncbi:uncharacterized protein Z520_11782 [Fonsecaea multimorphosa CBS 102226]|uniref:Heterokaryon incompatibility domain-containing protein n=1 Tax=Fonsecaea multimorphosa CBS 102226 TaxID=1442371 RepID=A0A0D2JH05_9EURO|nr:uncharacterized protein Z520_11782 [Fonsecaea multimorphosa CBS 102226]KIX92462.1 hypothetical protein Z520_11782 [Fonsecaea multimorphosa CBS 102226]OAL19578.1 hypothetical protein AYO22_09740 [Fonsecaea multimorphosa]